MASKGRSRTRAPAVWLQSPCFRTHTVSARPSPRSLERHESPCQSTTELASMTPHHPVHPTRPKREQAPSPATHAASASPSTRIRATCSRLVSSHGGVPFPTPPTLTYSLPLPTCRGPHVWERVRHGVRGERDEWASAHRRRGRGTSPQPGTDMTNGENVFGKQTGTPQSGFASGLFVVWGTRRDEAVESAKETKPPE